jgi:hypothetical protein
MECSGARWSLDGAEAVLRLRALQMGGDGTRAASSTKSRSAFATTRSPALSAHWQRERVAQWSHTHYFFRKMAPGGGSPLPGQQPPSARLRSMALGGSDKSLNVAGMRPPIVAAGQ